jgi:hypothetical protein
MSIRCGQSFQRVKREEPSQGFVIPVDGSRSSGKGLIGLTGTNRNSNYRIGENEQVDDVQTVFE